MANEIKKRAGVSGNSVAGKSFQIFTVSEELLAKVVEAVQAGDKEARSSGNIQSFEVFCHGFRANISLGRIMVVPAKVCNDRKNFPTALLHGAIIRVFGTGGEEVADLVEKKIGESEFDEYSQADFDTIKKEIFTDKATGEEASLVVFAPNWMNSREYICFHFSDDAEQLKNDLRHQVFSAYYNPAVSSAFNALMTNVDTTKVDVTDITPKLSYPFLTENPLKAYPSLEKQAGFRKATILLNRKTADDITKQTLEPEELNVFDSLNQALENSIMPATTSVEDAGEDGYRAPDDGGVPREASAKDAGGTKRFYESRNDLAALEAQYDALPVTATPEEFVAGKGNWGLTEGEYTTAMELATNIVRLKSASKKKRAELVGMPLNELMEAINLSDGDGLIVTDTDLIKADIEGSVYQIKSAQDLGDTIVNLDGAGLVVEDEQAVRSNCEAFWNDYQSFTGRQSSAKVAHIGADGVCPGCKKAGSECACNGCTCKTAFAKKAFVAHVPGHKNSKGESAPWVIKQHNTGKILESFKSEAAAKAGLRNMESHKGSVEVAPHEAPFTNVGPGSAAHDKQEASAPAMKESVTEDAGRADEESGSPIGIAIDETGVPRSKTEESEGKSKADKTASKRAAPAQNQSVRKHDTVHPETQRVGQDRLSSAYSAAYNGGFVDRHAMPPQKVRDYMNEKMGNNAEYAPHAAADHEKEIKAGAYGDDPLNRRSNEKWGSATVNVNFKRSTAGRTFPTGDDFTDAYIEAALWSSMDNSDPNTGGDPLDKNYGHEDIAPATLERFRQDCAKFQKDNAKLLEQAYQQEGYNGHGEWSAQEQAGHDFWLTRNGHGAGFWDRDALRGGLGDALSKAAKTFGEADLYVGDDGLVYQMGAEGSTTASYVASQVVRTASAPYEAMSAKAKKARAAKESLLDKFRPKTAVELDIDSIWDAITEDMGPAPLVDVPEMGDGNPAPSNTEQHEGFDEEPKAPSKSPNKKDIGDLPEAFRSEKPEEDKAIDDGEAESQETDLENSATESEEHREDEGEKKWHEANWNPESKFADFINEVAEDIENEEQEGGPRLRCDQCNMVSINGTPVHEQGCPNDGARWDAENGMWIPQRECFECGSEVDEDDPCCSAPVMDEAEEARWASSGKKATGEMDQSDADDPDGWPLHHAIANALGGKVKAFDQYQGPYVLIGSEVRGQGTYAPATPMRGTVRLWIQGIQDDTDPAPMLQVYNEDNEKLSEPFMWNDTEGAVEAAKSVLDTPPTKGKGKALAVGASAKGDRMMEANKADGAGELHGHDHHERESCKSAPACKPKKTKKADTADNGYDIDKAKNPSDKETGPSDTVDCHQDYNSERSEGTDRPKPNAGADIKQAGPKKRVYEDAMIDNEKLLHSIRHGDRVTIMVPAGRGREGQEWKEATGTAVMHSAEGGWVLNMGGQHGTPGLANERNIVRVKKGRPVPGQERLGSGKKADTADNPANWRGGEGIIQPKTDATVSDTTGPDVKSSACKHQPHDEDTTQTTCERCNKELYYNAKTDRWTTSKSKKADGISGDAAEAKSETVSPDTVDKDIQQPTVSVSEAAKVASTWMNEYEIQEAAQVLGGDPMVGKYVRFLQEFVGEVNSHSDGWPYWKAPAHAAGSLMTLIKAAFDQKRGFTRHGDPVVEVTEQALRKAMGPIKSFYTRRGNAAGMQVPKLAASQFGSQLRELIADSGYELVRLEGEPGSQTAILHPVNGGPDEMWYESDDHAGYTIEIDGMGYEFGRDVPREYGRNAITDENRARELRETHGMEIDPDAEDTTPKWGADVSGDMSEAKAETVSPDTVDGDIQQPTVSVEEAGKSAAIGERNDDVPVSEGDIPDEKQPKSDLSAAPEAHDAPPQVDGKTACGEGHPESVQFDWGAGDLADIVLIEDENEE